MRRLYLRVSALSDAEYNLYVADLMELSFTDRCAAMQQDEDYERVIIDVREVRARFRGRYRSVTVADVDMVCNNERKWGYVFSLSDWIIRYLSPTIQKTDTLCGGEFFAAIRLVIHAFQGRHIDRDLVFVQGKSQRLSDQSVLCLTFILSQPNGVGSSRPSCLPQSNRIKSYGCIRNLNAFSILPSQSISTGGATRL